MARLIGEQGLSLSVKVLEICAKCGWTRYEVLLLWRGSSIIDDNVLRDTDWPTRTPGALLVGQHGIDRSLVLAVQTVLETGKRSYWKPLSSVVVDIAISRPTIHCDEFEVVVSADVNMFEGCEYCGSGGLSLTMTVTGESLAEFCAELKEEHDRLVCADCDGGSKS